MHAFKVIHTALTALISHSFTPADAQYGFPRSLSIQQALLRAQANTMKGLQHVAVLYLDKAYGNLDRTKLLHALAKHQHSNGLRMVRATLGLMRLHTKNDPTRKTATITRGVPKVAPSSPIDFNVYIDELAKEVEAVMG